MYSRVFQNCSKLTTVATNTSATNIVNLSGMSFTSSTDFTRTFLGCSAITAVVIPDGITALGEAMFQGCTGLQSIALPNTLTTIGSMAFGYNYSNWTNLVIEVPDTLNTIAADAFKGTGNYTLKYAGHTSAVFAALLAAEGFITTNNNVSYDFSNSDVTLDTLTTALAGWSDTNLAKISSIDLTDCANVLSAITADSSLTTTGVWATLGNKVTWPQNHPTVTVDGTTVTIQHFEKDTDIVAELQEMIAENATVFANVKKVVIEGEDLTELSALGETVDYGSTASTTGYSDFFPLIEELDLTGTALSGELGNRYLQGITTLKKVFLPSAITSFTRSFIGCSALTTISNNPSATEAIIDLSGFNITTLSESFTNCTAITKVVLPGSLTTIGYNALRGCTKLEEVVMPGVQTIAGSSFGFTTFESNPVLVVSDALTTIEVDAFKNSSNFTLKYSGTAATVFSELFDTAGFLSTTGTVSAAYDFSGSAVQLSTLEAALNAVNSANYLTRVQSIDLTNCANVLSAITADSSLTTTGVWATLGNKVTWPQSNPAIIVDDITVTIENYASDNTIVTELQAMMEKDPSVFAKVKQVVIRGGNLTELSALGETVDYGSTASTTGYSDFFPLIEELDLTGTALSGELGNRYLQGITTLKKVFLPSAITSFTRSFIGCSALTTISNNPSATEAIIDLSGFNITTLSESFTNCTAITKVVLPGSLTTIGYNALRGCTKLEEVVMPGVQTIAGSSFGFTTFESNPVLVVSDALTTIEVDAFKNSSNFTLKYSGTAATVFSELFDTAGFLSTTGTVSAAYDFSGSAVQLSTLEAALNAVNSANYLTRVQSIDLTNCANVLSAITADSSLTTTGVWATLGNKVTWPQNHPTVTVDGTTVTIQHFEKDTDIVAELQEMIAENATVFANVKKVVIEGEDLTELSALGETVDYGSTASTTGYSDFFPLIEELDLTGTALSGELGNRYLQGITTLKKVFLPSAITSFTRSFIGCSALTTISNTPSATEAIIDLSGFNITTLYESFTNCTAITKVVLPGSLTTIGYNALRGCTKLEEVVMPGVQTIAGSSFGFTIFQNGLVIVVPDTLTDINVDAFKDSSKFTLKYSGATSTVINELLDATATGFLSTTGSLSVSYDFSGSEVSFDTLKTAIEALNATQLARIQSIDLTHVEAFTNYGSISQDTTPNLFTLKETERLHVTTMVPGDVTVDDLTVANAEYTGKLTVNGTLTVQNDGLLTVNTLAMNSDTKLVINSGATLTAASATFAEDAVLALAGTFTVNGETTPTEVGLYAYQNGQWVKQNPTLTMQGARAVEYNGTFAMQFGARLEHFAGIDTIVAAGAVAIPYAYMNEGDDYDDLVVGYDNGYLLSDSFDAAKLNNALTAAAESKTDISMRMNIYNVQPESDLQVAVRMWVTYQVGDVSFTVYANIGDDGEDGSGVCTPATAWDGVSHGLVMAAQATITEDTITVLYAETQDEVVTAIDAAFDGKTEEEIAAVKTLKIKTPTNGAFSGVLKGLSQYTSITTYDFSETVFADNALANEFLYGNKVVQTVVLPTNLPVGKGLFTIGRDAFNRCAVLTEVNIPATVTALGIHAFEQCNALTTVGETEGVFTIPNTVTVFGTAEKSTNPSERQNNGTNISRLMFWVTGISGVEYHGQANEAFYVNLIGALNYGINNGQYMTSIDLSDSNITEKELLRLSVLNGLETLDVTGCSNIDYTTPVGKLVLQLFEDMYEQQGTTVLYDTDRVDTPIVPETTLAVTAQITTTLQDALSSYAVADITDLTVTGALSETDITYLRENCTALRTLNISAATMDGNAIPANAFEGMQKLIQVQLPNTIVSIGNRAFASTDLQSIDIPSGVLSIGDKAFFDCDALTGTLTLPNSLTSFGDDVFNQSALTKLEYHGSIDIQFSSNFIGSVKWLTEVALDGTPTDEDNFTSIISFSRLEKAYLDYCDFDKTTSAGKTFYSNVDTVRQKGVEVYLWNQGVDMDAAYPSNRNLGKTDADYVNKDDTTYTETVTSNEAVDATNATENNTAFGTADYTVVVDNEASHTFDYYGAYFTHASSTSFAALDLTEDQRNALYEILYDGLNVSTVGIALPIGAYKTVKDSPYYYIQNFMDTAAVNEGGLLDYAISKKLPISVNASGFASYMLNDGKLTDYDFYTTTLARAVYDLRQSGLNVRYIGTGDEPDLSNAVSKEDMPALVTKMGAALAALGLTDDTGDKIAINAPDTANSGLGWASFIHADATAWNALGSMAWHDFNIGTVSLEAGQTSQLWGKPIYITSAGTDIYSETVGAHKKTTADGSSYINDYWQAVRNASAILSDVNLGASSYMTFNTMAPLPGDTASTAYTLVYFDEEGNAVLSANYDYTKQISNTIKANATVYKAYLQTENGVDWMKDSLARYTVDGVELDAFKKDLAVNAARNADGTWGINLLNKTYGNEGDYYGTKAAHQLARAGKTLTVNLDVRALYGTGEVEFTVIRTVPGDTNVTTTQTTTKLTDGRGTITIAPYELISLRSGVVNTVYMADSHEDIFANTNVVYAGKAQKIKNGVKEDLHTVPMLAYETSVNDNNTVYTWGLKMNVYDLADVVGGTYANGAITVGSTSVSVTVDSDDSTVLVTEALRGQFKTAGVAFEDIDVTTGLLVVHTTGYAVTTPVTDLTRYLAKF